MKRKLQLIGLLFATNFGFAQFTTGEVVLNGTFTAKIDTNESGVTLTLRGPSTTYLGIGFGGSTMSTARDMFIWSDNSNRDYSSSGQGTPTADSAANQSWTVTDNVVSGIRTVIATRALVSSGDFTFANNNTNISIIWAQGSGTSLNYQSARGAASLSRTTLGLEDFSLNATSIYPNPASGAFYIKTKTNLSKVNLYNQTGALVRTINVTDDSKEVELSVSNVQAGVYFLELQNDSEKSWKKVIVN